ncbi:MAG: hypothetical protein RML45_01320 [Acetobacteraceae bacterium]|nr:hypothetical protein [Acetobacteraceae bacterium]
MASGLDLAALVQAVALAALRIAGLAAALGLFVALSAAFAPLAALAWAWSLAFGLL